MAVIPDQLRTLAGSVPDEVAFTVVGVGSLTFREWDVRASDLARGMVAAGVAKGDRVALLCLPEDALAFITSYAATHKAAAVAVPVNTRLSAPEVRNILGHCEPSLVVVSDSIASLVEGVDTRVVRVSELDALAAGDGSDFQVDADLDDLAEILYTSGTTGSPKGVAIRHGNSAMTVFSEPTWSGKAWLHASPMFTFAGLAFVYQPMRMGMRTVYLPRFDVGRFLDVIETEQPMCAFLVPAMAELLVNHDRFTQADLSSLYMVSVGSAPSAPATLQRLQAALPNAAISNGYSMTEAGAAYCVLPKGELERRPGSCGKPLPPTKIRVVRDDGTDADADEVGEIVVQPPGRQREYFRDPEASADIWVDGWLHTGDLGRLDSDGYLYIVGRKKDLIIRGGYNVYPVDVESVLYAHPAVAEAAVVGVPHDVLGEDIAAFVVLAPDAECSVAELLTYCATELADYKRPRSIHLVDALPRNATGKVLKRELADTQG